MNKLISLEVKRNRLRPYHIAVLICGFILLAFHYFMAAIPLIDPKAPYFVLPQEVLPLLLKSDFCLAQNILQTKDTEQPLCGASE